MKKVFTLFVLALIVSCSPKVRTDVATTRPPLADDAEVIVLEESTPAPELAVDIGAFKIGDSGLSIKCNLETVLEEARTAARKAGGNVIKITRHTPPDLMSTCHRIQGRILFVEDAGTLANLENRSDAVVDSTWNYAKLYVYRRSGYGPVISYNLYLGDSIIARVANNFAEEIIVTEEGLDTLWARTESRAETPIEIEFGKVYYLRCSLNMGIMVGRPNLALVDATTGKTEYSAILERKQKKDKQ